MGENGRGRDAADSDRSTPDKSGVVEPGPRSHVSATADCVPQRSVKPDLGGDPGAE